jgi:hypothetical protein
LLELLEAQGLSVAKLADRISQKPGASEMSGEELLALMTAEPGEEFAGHTNAFDEAVVYQKRADQRYTRAGSFGVVTLRIRPASHR